MHGNGSGEIIYQISNNAFAYLQAMFKGSRDPTKYGLYINSQAPRSRGIAAEDYKEISIDADFTGSSTTEFSLLSKIQFERFEKFRWMNMLAADDESVDQGAHIGKYCSYSFEDDKSFPIPLFPLILFPKGVTVRIILWTDSWNCVPKKAIMTNAVYSNGGVITTIESRFKFSNSRIMTSEILLSSDDQKKIYDAFEKQEYLNFPMV